MSKMTPHDLQCPHCGTHQETMVWDSINVTLDPDLKQKLFAAEVNQFECQKCGKKSFVNAPLLYHDMHQEFCVQYYPSEALDDAQFFHQFNPDGSLPMPTLPAAFAKAGTYLTRPHIVFDMDELVRYVAFRDRIASASNG